MKVRLASILILTALPAWMSDALAQTVVSRGVGLSHDCFIAAKIGRNPRSGVDICDKALREEMMNLRNQAATHDNRGVLLDGLGRTGDATEDFNAAIRLDPTLGDTYVNLGSMMIKQRRLDEALIHINKGLDLGMSFPHIGYFNRAVAEELLGRYRDAYYDYKKALELEPQFEQASERLKDFKVTRAAAPG
jgi:tetratricopeptide (TPR) repeat protein